MINIEKLNTLHNDLKIEFLDRLIWLLQDENTINIVTKLRCEVYNEIQRLKAINDRICNGNYSMYNESRKWLTERGVLHDNVLELTEIRGTAIFDEYCEFDLPFLTKIEGNLYIENWKGSAPALTEIGGKLSIENWTGSANKLTTIGYYQGDLKYLDCTPLLKEKYIISDLIPTIGHYPRKQNVTFNKETKEYCYKSSNKYCSEYDFIKEIIDITNIEEKNQLLEFINIVNKK